MAANDSSNIDISRIPVSGVAGLGLVVMAAVVASGLPQLRWLAIGSLVGGAAIGLSLIAARNRRARKGATIGGAILFLATVVGLFLYLRVR